MQVENLKLLTVFRPSRLQRLLIPLLNNYTHQSTEQLHSLYYEAMGKDHPSENDFLIAYYTKQELDTRTQNNQNFRAKLQAKLAKLK